MPCAIVGTVIMYNHYTRYSLHPTTLGCCEDEKEVFYIHDISEPPHDKPNKMVCAPSEDSDQPGHPPV